MSITKQAAQGVAWNMAFGVGSRLLTLASSLILTRFYSPGEYGEAIAASIAVLTASALTSFAFGQYIIAKKASAEIAAQAMVIHMILGVLAMVTLYIFREPAAAFVHAPGMTKYIVGFSISQLIDRARYVPERLIMRALRFRTLATINGLGELTFAATALATGPRFGAYAIMFAWIARSCVTSSLFFYAAPRDEWLVRVRMRLADALDLMRYGLPIMVANATDNATRRWDNYVVSGTFSTEVMGHYQLAYSLAETPIINVAEHIGEVLMPSFSRMEEGQRERAAIRSAALMSLIISPLGVGLGAVAPTLTVAFFDERWGPTLGPMLMILSIMTVFRPITWSAIAYVQAVQRTRVVMWSSFLRAIAVLVLVYVGGQLGGPNGACIGVGAAFAAHSIGTIFATTRATGLSGTVYLAGCLRTLLPCVPMYFAVTEVARLLAGVGVPNVASLAIQVVVGAVVYIVGAFVFCRSDSKELIRLARATVKRRRG